MYMIAGLGNPGKDYEYTRHNVGFRVMDYMAAINGIKISKIKFKGLYGEGLIEGEKVILLKPQTYMNHSGESILDAVQFFKIGIENLIVVYDDMSMPLGRIRIRPSGSDGGHNGMKSIIYLLENNNFPRLRVGIGKAKEDMVSHVLGRFAQDERAVMDDVLKVTSDALKTIIGRDLQTAMNQYNSYRHEFLNVEEKRQP